MVGSGANRSLCGPTPNFDTACVLANTFLQGSKTTPFQLSLTFITGVFLDELPNADLSTFRFSNFGLCKSSPDRRSAFISGSFAEVWSGIFQLLKSVFCFICLIILPCWF